MTNTKTLYQGLLSLLDRGQWQDWRHLQTAVSMIVKLILSSSSSLTKWIPYTLGRALQELMEDTACVIDTWISQHL